MAHKLTSACLLHRLWISRVPRLNTAFLQFVLHKCTWGMDLQSQTTPQSNALDHLSVMQQLINCGVRNGSYQARGYRMPSNHSWQEVPKTTKLFLFASVLTPVMLWLISLFNGLIYYLRLSRFSTTHILSHGEMHLILPSVRVHNESRGRLNKPNWNSFVWH